jgi:hypothetical protein
LPPGEIKTEINRGQKMNEYLPPTGRDASEHLVLPVPHIPEDLPEYFYERAMEKAERDEDLSYVGYSDLASEAIQMLGETSRIGITADYLEHDIAIVPGRSEGIRPKEQTAASIELFELIVSTYNLAFTSAETTDKNPYGRTLWQGAHNGLAVNIIENRIHDEQGDIVKFTAVSHVPEELLTVDAEKDRFRSEVTSDLEEIPVISSIDVPVIDVDALELMRHSFRRVA